MPRRSTVNIQLADQAQSLKGGLQERQHPRRGPPLARRRLKVVTVVQRVYLQRQAALRIQLNGGKGPAVRLQLQSFPCPIPVLQLSLAVGVGESDLEGDGDIAVPFYDGP